MSYFYDAKQIIKEAIDIMIIPISAPEEKIKIYPTFDQALLIVMEATKRREIEILEEQLGNYEERKRSYKERQEKRNKR